MPIHTEELRRYLAESLGRPVYLRINHGTSTLISTKRDACSMGLVVTLNALFLEGPDSLKEAVARFAKGERGRATAVLRKFYAENQQKLGKVGHPARSRRIKGSPVGRVYELESRAQRINEAFFGGAHDFRIIWSKPGRSARQRTIVLGTWNSSQRIIRIHPILDNEGVPEFVLDFIIYHEQLHIAIPSVFSNGRMVHHSNEFRLREAQFPRYREFLFWEQKEFPKLLRQWAKGERKVSLQKPQDNPDFQLNLF